MKLGHSIMRLAGLCPLATTINDVTKEEVETTTTTFGNMLRRCGDINIIYEKEDEFSESAVTLVQDQTAGYNSDNTDVEGNNQQDFHTMTVTDLEQVERAHNAYRATLEYRRE